MADEDDIGQQHLKNVMSEGQNMSVPAGRGITGSGSRGTTGSKDASYQSPGDRDGDYQDEYSPTNFNAGGAKRVNRKDKGAKGSGGIGTDSWNQNKSGGDGY
jgi:hypothetical protein